MSKTAKLHEILAVEADLVNTAKKVVGETITTFTKKGNHFLGHVKVLQMFSEERQREAEGASEIKEIVETVPSKLFYTAKSLVKCWNGILQKEATNQNARADLVVNGETLATALPATFLLGMETRLKDFRNVLEAIPTHEPGIVWVPDPDKGPGIYRSKEPQLTKREEKVLAHKVLVEATKEHPAQIEKWTENQVVGTYVLTKWTSTLSPAQKSMLLDRCDDLIRAMKAARQRANQTDLVKIEVGQILLDYILSPLV